MVNKDALVVAPDPRLRKICEECPGMMVDVARNMLTLLVQWGGLGLSAPQIGLSQRFFVMANGLVAVNPTLTLTGMEIDSVEGCLSVPDKMYKCRRRNQVHLKTDFFHTYLDGIWAIVAQHEMDHLNGILIGDHGVNLN